MTAPIKERNGSFKGIRAGDLLLFDPAVQRHDRGWPRSPPRQAEESAHQRADEPPERVRKTAGILHFPHHEDSEEEAEPGNAGSC